MVNAAPRDSIGVHTGTVDRILRGVDVEDQIDTLISKHLHALIVVLGVIDGVDTDGIETQLPKVGNVTLAVLGVGEGVLGGGVAALFRHVSSEMAASSSDMYLRAGNRLHGCRSAHHPSRRRCP